MKKRDEFEKQKSARTHLLKDSFLKGPDVGDQLFDLRRIQTLSIARHLAFATGDDAAEFIITLLLNVGCS